MLLKSRSGEFDLESILFLKLRSVGMMKLIEYYLDLKCCSLKIIIIFNHCLAGIHDLGCIGECINLERLDLSGNNITNLAPLGSLRLLLVLNLSSNRISNLGKVSGAVSCCFYA